MVSFIETSSDSIRVEGKADDQTYLETCLLRSAESFAVQGLMMVSDGEMYCLELKETNVTLVTVCKVLKIAKREVTDQ